MKTTNYYSAFISVAEDCPATLGEVPPSKGTEQTVATLQYELVARHPYEFTSDDVLFFVYAQRKHIPEQRQSVEREQFFAKGQPCLRSSPLTKRYGWGVHSNADGKIALYPLGSEDYATLASDPHLRHYKAMRSKRA